MKRAHPTYQLPLQLLHMGRRFRYSIQVKAVVASLEVYEHLWHLWQQVWRILVLAIVRDQHYLEPTSTYWLSFLVLILEHSFSLEKP